MVWSKLKTRVRSAALLTLLLLIITFAPPLIFSLALCGVSIVVLREITVTFKHGKKPYVLLADYIVALALMITGLVQKEMGGAMYLILMLYVIALLTIAIVRNQEVSFQDVCASLFAVLYAVLFLMPLSFIRQMDNGLALVFLAFVGAWIPDTAAYFAGSFLGKHKLIEAISPNKTVEGSVGAIVGSVVGFLIYGAVLSALGYVVNYFLLIVLALLCGVVAQLGDLSASLMKRAYQAKDFGNLIPGHGGLLDRVDSLLFITPLVYYFISFLPVLY